jgi:hypothetical protein
MDARRDQSKRLSNPCAIARLGYSAGYISGEAVSAGNSVGASITMTNAQAFLIVGLVAIAAAVWLGRLEVQPMPTTSMPAVVVTDRLSLRVLACGSNTCNVIYPPKAN